MLVVVSLRSIVRANFLNDRYNSVIGSLTITDMGFAALRGGASVTMGMFVVGAAVTVEPFMSPVPRKERSC